MPITHSRKTWQQKSAIKIHSISISVQICPNIPLPIDNRYCGSCQNSIDSTADFAARFYETSGESVFFIWDNEFWYQSIFFSLISYLLLFRRSCIEKCILNNKINQISVDHLSLRQRWPTYGDSIEMLI